jgi:hypothetical protein
MSGYAAFEGAHPGLAFLLHLLLGCVLTLAVWFVISAVFALLHGALRDAIERATDYCRTAATTLIRLTAATWGKAADVVDAFVENLSLRWVFSDRDERLRAQLKNVRSDVHTVGTQLHDEFSKVDGRIASFETAVQGLHSPEAFAAGGIGDAELAQQRDAARARRSSLIILVVGSVIVFGLISLNTMMLSKFFESMIDEYLSFKWGIKVSLVLALFFSMLELGLGIVLYNYGREKDGKSIAPAMVQSLIVLLAMLLALVETYLYYRLSLEMNLGKAAAVDDIAVIPAWVSSVWLAPFGPVIVASLVLMGHVLLKSMNTFMDAGLQRDHITAVREVKRTLAEITRSGGDVQRRIADAKTACGDFLKWLSDAGQPKSAVNQVQSALQKLSDAAESAANSRLEPYSTMSVHEARRQFAYFTGLCAFLVVIAVVFCVIQVSNVAQNSTISSELLLAAALAQIGAACFAGYRFHATALLVSGNEAPEIIHGDRHWWTVIWTSAVIIAVIACNVASSTDSLGKFHWLPFLLGMVCLAAATLIGPMMPTLAATARAWIDAAAFAIAAFLIFVAAALAWMCSLAVRIVGTAIYALAYPMLLLLKRRAPKQAQGAVTDEEVTPAHA